MLKAVAKGLSRVLRAVTRRRRTRQPLDPEALLLAKERAERIERDGQIF